MRRGICRKQQCEKPYTKVRFEREIRMTVRNGERMINRDKNH